MQIHLPTDISFTLVDTADVDSDDFTTVTQRLSAVTLHQFMQGDVELEVTNTSLRHRLVRELTACGYEASLSDESDNVKFSIPEAIYSSSTERTSLPQELHASAKRRAVHAEVHRQSHLLAQKINELMSIEGDYDEVRVSVVGTWPRVTDLVLAEFERQRGVGITITREDDSHFSAIRAGESEIKDIYDVVLDCSGTDDPGVKV